MAVSTVATELAEGKVDNQVAESVLHGGQVGCLAWSDPETVGREAGGGAQSHVAHAAKRGRLPDWASPCLRSGRGRQRKMVLPKSDQEDLPPL